MRCGLLWWRCRSRRRWHSATHRCAVRWELSCYHIINREQSRRCVHCYQSHRAAVRRQTDRKVALSLKKLRLRKRSGGRKVARRDRALEWPACRRGLAGVLSVVVRCSRESSRFRPACVKLRVASTRISPMKKRRPKDAQRHDAATEPGRRRRAVAVAASRKRAWGTAAAEDDGGVLVCVANHRRSKLPFTNRRNNVGAYGTLCIHTNAASRPRTPIWALRRVALVRCRITA
jgi:hypothetical protein